MVAASQAEAYFLGQILSGGGGGDVEEFVVNKM